MSVQVEVQSFRASEIIRGCGISGRKQKQDVLRKITDAVTVPDLGVIDELTVHDVCVG